MKLLYNKKHIKTIPKKFSEIEDVHELLDDFEYKRLTETERLVMNKRLLSKQVAYFLENKKKQGKLKSFIKDSHPVKVLRIETRDVHYYTIKMANGTELKCPAELYRISPLKETVKRLY